ncbi:MAG TPA: hypothetical protein VGW35_02555 [Methylomirabilota bacterium]|jgi:hypothetical protein|nr:hypothetical protein [Methylomirabilota bacterium]
MPDATPSRKTYVKPDLTRVDLVEEEVALAVCKTLAPQTVVKGAASGGCAAKGCKNDTTS